MSEAPWCPAGCTRDLTVSTALADAIGSRLANADAAAANHLLEAFGTVDCPKCGRPIDIWASREWTFDCSKGEAWTETPARGRGGVE